MRLKHSACLSALLAGCLLLAIAQLAPGSPGVTPKTLARTADPVVVPGEKISSLLDRPIAALRLYAHRDGDWKPIPFQIDERDGDGRLVFPLGRCPNADNDDDRFDANDELVFMAADAGDRPESPRLPNGCRRAALITLRDRQTGQKAYAWLFDFADPPPPSPVDYVSWDSQTRTIKSRLYTLGYHNDRVPALLDTLTFRRGPRAGLDLLDRYKLRIHASLLAGTTNIVRTEQDLNVDLLAYLDGPVRMIQKLKYTLNMLLGIESPSVIRLQTSYLNSSDFPNIVSIPFHIDYVFTDVRLITTLDWTTAIAPATYYSEYNGQGLAVNGQTDQAESAFDRTFGRWMAIGGDFGGIVGVLSMSKKLQDMNLPNRLYYTDDQTAPDAPEDEAGQVGNFGWEITNLNRLPKGKYSINIKVYFAETYRPGDHRAFLNIHDFPLDVAVEKVKSIQSETTGDAL